MDKGGAKAEGGTPTPRGVRVPRVEPSDAGHTRWYLQLARASFFAGYAHNDITAVVSHMQNKLYSEGKSAIFNECCNENKLIVFKI